MTEFKAGDRVTVEGYEGVAFFLSRRASRWESDAALVLVDEWGEPTDHETDGTEWVWCEIPDEGEWVEDPQGPWIAVMVGDDQPHKVEESMLAPLDEGDYCPSCGQIGCDWALSS